MFRLGLTGGIGSGKSTAAQMLTTHGGALVDADAISRQLTAPNGAAMAQIMAQFGTGVVTPEGAMNRDAMRQRVFANADVRQQLERIIHPLVSLESDRLAILAAAQNRPFVIFDVPLLIESNRWRQELDKILVIDCEEATQINRVLSRDASSASWTRSSVENVVTQQATRQQRRATADWVIYNEEQTLAELALQISQIAQRIAL